MTDRHVLIQDAAFEALAFDYTGGMLFFQQEFPMDM